jgi:hypothetical protein
MKKIRSRIGPGGSMRLNLTATDFALTEKKALSVGNRVNGVWLQRLAVVRIVALEQMRALNRILLI